MKHLTLYLLVFVLLISCGKKNPDTAANLPELNAISITSFYDTIASLSASVASDGGAAVTERGFCWSINRSPLRTGSHLASGTGTGVFTGSIGGLTPSTTYYVRAYAVNANGTAYSSEAILTTTAAPIVYIVGVEDGQPRFWKNGVLQPLNLPVTTASPRAVFVTDKNDVYIAGAYRSANPALNGQLWVWKNGTSSFWTNGSNDAAANCMTVSSDGTVYVGGYEHNGAHRIAKYWINGSPVTLASNITLESEVNAIYVDGSDVYASGYENTTVKLWKNGVAVNLTLLPETGSARGLTVMNGTAYTSGIRTVNQTSQRGNLWINGKDSALMNGTVSYATDITNSGSDLYIAVGKGKVPYIWKNGALLNMDYTANSTTPMAVFAQGSNIHACGFEDLSGGKYKGLYWVNGKASPLTDGTTNCLPLDIYVR